VAAAVFACGLFSAGALGHAAVQASPPKPAAEAQSNPGKTPDVSKEALAWDKLITRYRFENDGTGTREMTAVVRVLADAGVK
jgi:hypothetical protein